MERRCNECSSKISRGRIEAIPDCQTCVKCSHERPRTEADVQVDGTAGDELVRIVGRTAEGER